MSTLSPPIRQSKPITLLRQAYPKPPPPREARANSQALRVVCEASSALRPCDHRSGENPDRSPGAHVICCASAAASKTGRSPGSGRKARITVLHSNRFDFTAQPRPSFSNRQPTGFKSRVVRLHSQGLRSRPAGALATTLMNFDIPETHFIEPYQTNSL